MNKVKIAWYGLHLGEEPPLIPAGGIFFTGCDLRCVFCQNHQISQGQIGKVYTTEELIGIMLQLEKMGASNIDLVSPNGWFRVIKSAIIRAREAGLKIPIVWNSNGFEKLEVLREMKGLIDIYLPDFKYSDDSLAKKYSGIENYTATAINNIQEMLAQVGHLKIVKDHAVHGVIVRHLVLPNQVKNSLGVLEKLAEIDKNLHLSLMNQYLPIHQADNFSELNRQVTDEEFATAYDYLLELGFANGWVQGEKSQNHFVPDFRKEEPFRE
jgi:putative pyruvate formate lyase activating enzyme